MSSSGQRVTYTREGITYYPAPFPEVFNVTLIITGILWLPFFATAFAMLKDNGKSTFLLALTAITGTLSGPFLIGVGIYDVGTYFDNHVFFAKNLYLSIAVTSILWALSIISLNKDSEYKKSKWQIDIVISLIISALMVINYFGKQPPVYPLSKIPIPTYQKTVAYLYIGYFAVVVRRLWKIYNSSGN